MSNDLVVQLGARLDQFASDLNQAGDMADSAVGRIESSFASLNPGLGSFAGLGAVLTGAGAAAAGLLATLSSVNGELAAISRNAEYVGVSVERFQSLLFASGQGGVSSAQATTDLRNVARLLSDAKENENSLTKLLDANNVKYTDRNGDVIKLNELLAVAGDLINRFHSMPEKVEAAKMLGLSESWVQALHDGGKAFDDVANSAEAAGAVIDRSTIAKAEAFDTAWKKSSDLLSRQFKAVTADIAVWLDDLIAKGGDFVAALAQSNGAGAGSGQEKFNAIADAIDVVRKEAQGLDQDFEQVNRVLEHYQKLGSADPEIISALEQIRVKAQATADKLAAVGQLASKLSFPGGVPLPSGRPGSADDTSSSDAKLPQRKTDADNKDAFERSVDQANKRIALVNAETTTIGQNTEARERAKIVAQLEEAAKRANADAGKELYGVTEATNPKIAEQADKMLEAARAAREQQTAFQGLNDAVRFGGNELVNVLDQASQKGANFGQIMTKVMQDVTKQILQAAITGEGAFAKLFGFSSSNGGVGGLGGLFANIFGGGSGGVGANGSIIGAIGPTSVGGAPLVGFAGGTDSAPGGLSIVGENGPEIMNVPAGAQIIPNDVSKAMGGGYAFTYAPKIDARGASADAVARLATVVTNDRANFERNVQAVVAKTRRNNPGGSF